jgi:hypothetical protein
MGERFVVKFPKYLLSRERRTVVVSGEINPDWDYQQTKPNQLSSKTEQFDLFVFEIRLDHHVIIG